jgi:tetratricopeptide (TPR) repeat protein
VATSPSALADGKATLCDGRHIGQHCELLSSCHCPTEHHSRLQSFVSIVFLVIVVGVAPAAAQQGDIGAINQRAKELFEAGNFAAALVELQKFEAAVKARFGTNSAHYATALNARALVYKTQGRYADAEPLYRQALAISEKALGPDNPIVAVALNNLAEL